MPIAKIPRYQLEFANELSSAANATAIKGLKVSAGDRVNHRIRGYYGRPVSSADIAVEFNCVHPSSGLAKYLNGSGSAMRRWKDVLIVDGPIRRDSAAQALGKLVVAAPPAPVYAVIDCTFEVKKRWSRELSDWVPVASGHSGTCTLRYKIEP